jgi:tRNA(Ile)-lysidine synthase
MVLLHVLHSLAQSHRWKIAVAHFNHRLRGRASDADETLVRRTAQKLGLNCLAGGADVRAFAARAKISVEMAARQLRHEFLARAARRQKIVTVALAHHADDQVELFFVRLLRGAGGAGLAGMKWRSPSPAAPSVSLVRPLLGFPKAELLAFAAENKVRFRDDATNFSRDVLRNRIRHELLPLLRRKYQPAVDRTVLRLMDIVGAEAEFVAGAAGQIRHPFAGLPLALQRKVLQQQLVALGLPPDFERIEQLREMPDQSVSVAAGVSVARDAAGKVSCRREKTGSARGGEALVADSLSSFNPAERKVKLKGRAGRVAFGGLNVSWKISPAWKSSSAFRLPPSALHRECFDADRVGGEIVLRHWRPGDRFQPIGLKAPVKLQDLFVNAKIPAARRRLLLLAVAARGEIFWVEGLRIGETGKWTPKTRRKLVWKWSRAAKFAG